MANTTRARQRAKKPASNGAGSVSALPLPAGAEDLDPSADPPEQEEPEFASPQQMHPERQQQQQMRIPQLSAEAALTQVIVELKQNAFNQLTEYQIRSGQVIQELLGIAEQACGLHGNTKAKPTIEKLKARLAELKSNMTQVNV